MSIFFNLNFKGHISSKMLLFLLVFSVVTKTDLNVTEVLF